MKSTPLAKIWKYNWSKISRLYSHHGTGIFGLCHLWNISFRSLRWRRNGHGGVLSHQPHHCLLNRLFRCRSKKTSKLRVTGLCVGNSPETGEFPAQMASNAENVSIWWRHHNPHIWCIMGSFDRCECPPRSKIGMFGVCDGIRIFLSTATSFILTLGATLGHT